MKHFGIILLLIFSALCLEAQQCTPDNASFIRAYWLSQPSVLRTAFSSPNPSPTDQNARSLKAAALASQGYVIDAPIMVFGWDACQAMYYRKAFGLTWVPSALQPAVDVQTYNPAKPPAGSIKVSTDAKDYPPFDPPAPAAPTPAITSYVGPQIGGCIYGSVTGDPSADGAQVTRNDQTFTKHKTTTPFATVSYYTLNGCQ